MTIGAPVKVSSETSADSSGVAEEQTRPARVAAIIAPVAVSLAFVMTAFADTHPFVYEAWRSLFAAAAVTVAVQGVAILVFRDVQRGSIVAAIVLLTAIEARIGLTALWFWLLALYLRRRGRRISLAVPALMALIALLAMSAVRVVTSPSFALSDLTVPPHAGGETVRGDPDIFLIMLDGYPRSDTLANMGFDNADFERELERRGFSIAESSTSSYPYTFQVLTTMFNMAHIVDIADVSQAPTLHVDQMRILHEALNSGRVMESLEERGYHTVSAGLPEVRGSLRGVDDYVDRGEVRLWERQLLQRMLVGPLACELIVLPQHRSLIESTFVAIEGTAKTAPAPTFMFAHVLSPHTPIVFGSGGEPVRTGSADCWSQFNVDATLIGLSDDDFAEAMSAQIQYLNERTLDAIDELVAARPSAVVIVFSDHGSRYSESVENEWFRTFFASRTPQRSGLFGDDARSLDIFPVLFNAYFGDSYPVADARKFVPVHQLEFPYELKEWPWNE